MENIDRIIGAENLAQLTDQRYGGAACSNLAPVVSAP
jgi:hypothetical protein